MKSDIEKADVPVLRIKDSNNISADISKKLNYLSSKILSYNDQIFSMVPKHEMLTMCASGKDRTEVWLNMIRLYLQSQIN
ncbi:MAG: hypothetical protein AB8U25_04420 [Rickettsiales endosymbiont of Dermacentor nuttalli]